MTYSAILHVIDANEPLSIAKEETLLLVLSFNNLRLFFKTRNSDMHGLSEYGISF